MFNFYCVHVCVAMSVYKHTCAVTCKGQKRILDLLQLDLGAVVSHLMCVLLTEVQCLQKQQVS